MLLNGYIEFFIRHLFNFSRYLNFVLVLTFLILLLFYDVQWLGYLIFFINTLCVELLLCGLLLGILNFVLISIVHFLLIFFILLSLVVLNCFCNFSIILKTYFIVFYFIINWNCFNKALMHWWCFVILRCRFFLQNTWFVVLMIRQL